MDAEKNYIIGNYNYSFAKMFIRLKLHQLSLLILFLHMLARVGNTCLIILLVLYIILLLPVCLLWPFMASFSHAMF